MGKASQSAAPNIDPGRIGAIKDQATALWEEKNGRISLPTNNLGMCNVKMEINNMKINSMDVSATLSLLGSVDLYWKSQLLVEYSKDLHTCMILDGMQQEEGYLVQGGVIYYHGKVFLARDFKLKQKILQGAYEEFFLSHMYSMNIYTLIMKSFDWEGMRELTSALSRVQ